MILGMWTILNDNWRKNLFFLLFVVRKHVQNDVDCDRRGSGHLNHKKFT